MSMKTLMAVLMLIATSARAQTHRWVTIDNGVDYYLGVDSSSVVQISPTLVKVWVKSTLHHGSPVNEHDARIVRSWLARYEVDCIQRTIRSGPTVDYDVRGNVIAEDDFWGQPSEPMPETVGETILEEVCLRWG